MKDLTTAEIQEAIVKELEESFNTQITSFVVCKEKHEGGESHAHAWISFATPIEARPQVAELSGRVDYDFFSVPFGGVLHRANVQKPRSKDAVLKYIIKDGDYLGSEDMQQRLRQLADTGKTRMRWGDWVKEAMAMETFEDAMQLLWEQQPGQMALHADRIERNLRPRWPEAIVMGKPGPYPKFPEGYDPEEQALLVIGPSGIGKTECLLGSALHGHKRPLKIGNINGLVNLRKDTDLLIFDDMDTFWNAAGRTNQINLLQSTQGGDVRILYKTVRIQPGVTKWISSNMGFDTEWPEAWKGESGLAIRRRVFPVEYTGDRMVPLDWDDLPAYIKSIF